MAFAFATVWHSLKMVNFLCILMKFEVKFKSTVVIDFDACTPPPLHRIYSSDKNKSHLTWKNADSTTNHQENKYIIEI